MLYSDQFFKEKLIDLNRDPCHTEAKVWIGVALAAESDPRGIKILKEAFDQCLLLGDPIYSLWSVMAIKKHAPLENIQPLLTRFAMDQANREQSFEDVRVSPQDNDDLESVSQLMTSLEGDDLKSQAAALAFDWSAYDVSKPKNKIAPLLSAFDESILIQLLNVLELKSMQMRKGS